MSARWILSCLATLLALFPLAGCPGGEAKDAEREVVVYCALDRLYAQPILEAFERETKIKVKAKWDTEATKTTGLVQTLRAEAKGRVRCDVFWNNEVSHTIALAEDGLCAPYASPSAEGLPEWAVDPQGRWHGFAARARVIIVNTDLVEEEATPKTILAFKEQPWGGRCAIAKPLFGTTRCHVAALWAEDAEKAKTWLSTLKSNGVVVCAGNADVKDRVAQGELAFGLTDTDDANLAVLAKKPVKIVFPDQGPGGKGTLLIPNSVCIMKGAPNSAEAQALIDYLLRPEVERALAAARSAQIPLRKGIPRPKWIPEDLVATPVDWKAVAAALEPSRAYVEDVFLKE